MVRFKSAEEELATLGALKSNDPTAIAAAKAKLTAVQEGTKEEIQPPTEQKSVEQVRKNVANVKAMGGFNGPPSAVNLMPTQPAINKSGYIGPADELLNSLFYKQKGFSQIYGTMVEAIPIIGGLARKYGGSYFTTPSKESDAVLATLSEQNKGVKAIGDIYKINGDFMTAFEDLRQYDRQISMAEQKLKDLIIRSAELRSNPEEINKMMEQLKNLRMDIYMQRQEILKQEQGGL